MDDETDHDERSQQELVKPRIGYHDEALLHGDERDSFYRIHPLS
jgi:hypothetical protein